jgi:large subunit ribosomal protein L29
VKSTVVAKDLRGNDPEELRRTVRKLEEDLFKHKLKKNTNQLENTMLIRNTRRDIARVNTVLAERLRGVAIAPSDPANKSAAHEGSASAPASASAAAPATKKSAAKTAAKARKPAAKAATAKET